MGLIADARRNHALEHATINLLTHQLGSGVRIMGWATATGFYLHGDIPAEEVERAAAEALDRLNRGEADLAVSHSCGTNLAVTVLLTGLAAAIALGNENRMRRMPYVFMATLGSLALSQPLGRLVQKHITTSSQMGGLRILRVSRRTLSSTPVFKIETG